MRITARTGSHISSHLQDTIWIPWDSWSGWSVWFPGVSVLWTAFSTWVSWLLLTTKRGNVKTIQLIIHNDVVQLQRPPDIIALRGSDKIWTLQIAADIVEIFGVVLKISFESYVKYILVVHSLSCFWRLQQKNPLPIRSMCI